MEFVANKYMAGCSKNYSKCISCGNKNMGWIKCIYKLNVNMKKRHFRYLPFCAEPTDPVNYMPTWGVSWGGRRYWEDLTFSITQSLTNNLFFMISLLIQ